MIRKWQSTPHTCSISAELLRKVGGFTGTHTNAFLFVQVTNAPTSLHTDILNTLVMQQNASGCWRIDATFANLFGIQLEQFKQGISPQLQEQVHDAAKQESIWATMLALAFLEGACTQFKGEWNMLAQKVRLWLEKELASAASIKDVCLNDARKVFRQHGAM